MLDWKMINDHSEIPGTPMGVRLKYYLAVHRSAQYTSDVYMIWRARSGEIARWPHHLPITHIAEFNLPHIPEGKYPPTHVQPKITSDLVDLLEEEARVKSDVDRWDAGRDVLISFLRDLASDPEFAELVRQAGIDLSPNKEEQS